VFTDELHGRIARLEGVRSIKIPGVPVEPGAAKERVERLRGMIPADVTIGVSGDALAAEGINAGCDGWYSVVGGLFPKTALALTRAALGGDAAGARKMSERLEPLWAMNREYGSLRVMAAMAEMLGLVKGHCLPLPLQPLNGESKERVARVMRGLELE
jgi:4-hydroxy-tetrahydrodipicolinate synthase